jgi:hypothetical protein
MVFRFLRLVFALLICCVPALAQDARQSASPTAYSLVLSGLDGVDRPVSAAEFARLPRRDTTVNVHNVAGRYSGVLLSDLLALIHAPAGDSLRGKALATYLRVDGADGYRVVFALADFDPGYTDRIAILADRKNGTQLPAAEGPYHLIVPGEKRPARWVRQVVRIEIRRVP